VHRLFAIISCLLVMLIAITFWTEIKPGWVKYQNLYQTFLHAKDCIGDEKLGIKQDWLPELYRTDRCRTCHLGIADTSFKDAPQPLRTHPPIPHHDFNKFGCTVCHDGQGLATNTAEAHGRAGSWGYPLLPNIILEGGCGRCHKGNTGADTPVLDTGRQLIDKNGCIGCHKLPGFQRPDYIGPDLGRIAEKVRPAWIVSWIKDPREYLPQTIMPNCKFSNDQAEDAASFLMSNSQSAAKQVVIAANETIAAAGKLLFSRSRCVTCHALDSRGGMTGPDLGRAGDKLEPAWIKTWLTDPQSFFAKTRMPLFVFSALEVESLIAYLMTDLSYGDYTQDLTSTFRTQKAIDNGKIIIQKFGCSGCHGIPGITDSSRELALSLESIGSKTADQFVFTGTQIDKSMANWIFVKLLRPRVFGKDLVMPDNGFNADQAHAITTALIGQTYTDIPQAFVKPRTVPVARTITGPMGTIVNKYRCFVCHSIDGAGGTLAPDLSIEGSIAQPSWIKNYLIAPDAIRPFLVERMPKFNISPKEVGIIVDYFLTSARHDSIPSPDEWTKTGNAGRGKSLYLEWYNCMSCHTIGKTGGYYGPPLDNAGNRLEPAWIYARLLDAHRFDSSSREPRLVDNARDALDIMEYIKQLRKKGAAVK
jgi:mono/diheme cytochrome c family protein